MKQNTSILKSIYIITSIVIIIVTNTIINFNNIVYASSDKSIFPELDWVKYNKIFPNNVNYQSTITKREFIRVINEYIYDIKNVDNKCDYLCVAQKNGLLKNINDLDLPINYAKASKILLSSLGIVMADTDPWYKLWVDQMNKFDYLHKISKEPTEYITKYDAIMMFYYSPMRFRIQSSDYVKDVSNFVISYIENIEADNFDSLISIYWPQSIIGDIITKCNVNNINKYPLDLLSSGELKKIWDSCARFKTYQIEISKVDKSKENENEYIANVMFFQMKKGAPRSYFGNMEIKVKYNSNTGYRTNDFMLVKDLF